MSATIHELPRKAPKSPFIDPIKREIQAHKAIIRMLEHTEIEVQARLGYMASSEGADLIKDTLEKLRFNRVHFSALITALEMRYGPSGDDAA